MNPDIFKPVYDFLGLSYPGSYITILFFSFFMAFPIVYITAKRLGLTPWKQMLLPLTIVPTALVFSRIFHILFEGMFMYYIDGL
ncbi:MAG TPA: hypothetical protein PKG52_11530, partial [bacterium]|nr:hypothetical protein [bacterium]